MKYLKRFNSKKEILNWFQTGNYRAPRVFNIEDEAEKTSELDYGVDKEFIALIDTTGSSSSSTPLWTTYNSNSSIIESMTLDDVPVDSSTPLTVADVSEGKHLI